MSQKKLVHYIGNDPDFIKSISDYISEKKMKLSFTASSEYPVEVCLKDQPIVVFVDFTDVLDVGACIKQIILLKKTSKFRPTLFVGLFSDEDQLKEFDYVFSSGIQMSFIKGGEILLLFNDALYVAVGERISYPRYAAADGLYQKVTMGVCSSMTEISVAGLSLESDVDSIEGKLSMTQKIFPDFIEAEIASEERTAVHYPMMTTYELEFPALDPWADDTQFSIPTETIETWIDLHKDHLVQKKENIFVIEASTFLLKDIANSGLDEKLEITYLLEVDEIAEKLEKTLPPLIFVDVDANDDAPNSMRSIERMIAMIQSKESYAPVLILTSMPSSSVAIQKLVNYGSIACYPAKMSGEILKSCLELFIKKKLARNSGDLCAFSVLSPYRTVDVNLQIIIVRLTEHEVVFRCEENLPMFAVLHFLMPVEFYGILIPPHMENSDTRYKTAIIHGVSEKKLEVLRKFVNALIEKPDLDITMPSNDLPPTAKVEEVAPVIVEAIPDKTVEKTELRETRTIRFQGKSKL